MSEAESESESESESQAGWGGVEPRGATDGRLLRNPERGSSEGAEATLPAWESASEVRGDLAAAKADFLGPWTGWEVRRRCDGFVVLRCGEMSCWGGGILGSRRYFALPERSSSEDSSKLGTDDESESEGGAIAVRNLSAEALRRNVDAGGGRGPMGCP